MKLATTIIIALSLPTSLALAEPLPLAKPGQAQGGAGEDADD
jgi:hypothetical protein